MHKQWFRKWLLPQAVFSYMLRVLVRNSGQGDRRFPFEPTRQNFRVLTTYFVSFSILVTPLAGVTARPHKSVTVDRKSLRESRVGGYETAESAVAEKTLYSSESFVPTALPIISASMVDSLENDDGDGKIDPTNGNASTTERIVYSTTISNQAGAADATGLTFTDFLDAHTALVANTLNVSPLAGDDSYDTIGNTLLEVGPVSSPSSQPKVSVGTGGSPRSVFDNDTEFLGDTFTLSKLQATNYPGSGTVTASSTHGSVTMEGNGHFSYLPTAGYTGDDTFTYAIKDSTGLEGTATVTIHVNTQRVWYVQNNTVGANQGTSANPFLTLAAAQAAATGAGDIVYVFNGNNTTTNQNAGYIFQANNQRLIGEGVQLDAPVSVNGGPNPTVLRAAGTATKIGNSAGDAVTVTNKNGVIIRGFGVTASGNGIAVSYTAAGGGVTVSNDSIAGGTGNAIDVTTSGAGSGGSAIISNNAITAAGVEGIDINANGTGTLNLTVDTNTIAATGNGFDLQENGGACNLAFNNNTAITSSAGSGVNIVRVTGTLSVTAFANNQVNGTTFANGVVLNNVVFDSDPITGGNQSLSAGALNIGSAGAGSGVGASGLVLVNTSGTLPFTTLSIFADNGRGIDATGTGVATSGLTAGSGAVINAIGGAAVFINGMTIDLQNAIATSSNSTNNGVMLGVGSAVNGAFSATNASSITNAAGDDVAVGSGTADITWNATLNNTSGGNAVDISGHSGGTVSFTGAITDTVQGINLQNNTGATIIFSGGLSVSTGANAAFTATGGGTVTATQNNTTILNTLATTTGTALSVTNTTIGSNGLTFRSINTNGAANGITLNNTGASGGLTVMGDGANARNGTGGTLKGTGTGPTGTGTKTGNDVTLIDTAKISLSRMNIMNGGDYGVKGLDVNGFIVDWCTFSNNGDTNAGNGEGAIFFGDAVSSDNGLQGSAPGGPNPTRISNSDFSTSAGTHVRMYSSGGTLTGLDVKKNTFTGLGPSPTAGTGGGGLQLELRGSSTGTLKLTGNSFVSNFGPALQGTALGQSSLTFNVLGGTGDGANMFTNNAADALLVSNKNDADLTTEVSSNIFTGNPGNAIFVGNGTPPVSNLSSINAKILNNTITQPGGSPNVSTNHVVLALFSGTGAPSSVQICDNNITNNGQFDGIHVNTPDSGTSPNFSVSVNNNVVNNAASATNAINLNGRQSSTALFHAQGNTTTAPSGIGIQVREVSPATVNLERGISASSTASTVLSNNNPAAAGSPATFIVGAVTVVNNTLAGCSSPSSSSIQVESQQFVALRSQAVNKAADTFVTLLDGILQAGNIFDGAYSPADKHLMVVADGYAIQQRRTQPSTAAVAVPRPLSEPEILIPLSEEGLDSAIASTSKADATKDRRQTPAGQPRTAGETSNIRFDHAVMKRGNRNSKVPMSASPTPIAPDVSVSIGNLAAGKSVTVVFKVTLNNPPNLSLLGPPRVRNQGTVSGSNFSVVNGASTASPNTDDPTVGGTTDPTDTQADRFDSTTTLVSDTNPSNGGDPVTLTASVAISSGQSPTPPSPVTPASTVTFFDGVNPITCTQGGTAQTLNASAQAICTTSSLSAGSIHSITATYNGDGNYDSSTSNTVLQQVIACNVNPVVTKTADTNDGVCDADCSLREAIATTCNSSTITFNIPTSDPGYNAGTGLYTITLSGSEIAIGGNNLTITGPNSGANTKPIIISGNSSSRLFTINSGKTATISDVNLTGGNGSAGNGGALNNQGTLNLIGAAIYANTATGQNGAGVFNGTTGTLRIINSTLSSNSAALGGGVYNDGTLTLTNSTISGNTAANVGGGVYNHTPHTMMMNNTIVAGNAVEDIDSALGTISGDYNLVGDTTGIGGGLPGTHNITGVSANLSPLAFNGGRTQTMALLSTSPAIDSGNNGLAVDQNAAALTTDQRGVGFPRVADSADVDVIQTVDIGAFELHPSIEDVADQSTNEDTVKNVTFNLGDDTSSLIAAVNATSSNTTLVPDSNLSFSGSGGSRSLQITPAANLSGTTTITVTVTATNGRTATDSFDLSVNAVNDPPSGTDKTVSTAEETAYTFTATDLGFTDPNDSPANTLLAVKITTLPALGTLTNNNVPVKAGDFIPVADINGGLLKFTPAPNGNASPYTTFTFQVQDNGGGTDLDPTPNTTTINVTAVNDAPVNTVPGPQSTNEDTALVFSSGNGNQISVSDVDADSNPVKITLITTNGTLTLSTTAGLVFITGDGTADATMIFTGSLTAVNTALNGMSFTPTADFNGAASVQIVSDDQGNTGTGGPLTATDTVNITVNPQNDPPVLTTTVGNLPYTENAAATAIDPGLTVTDVDSPNLTGATVAITANFASGQDTLAFTNQLGITGNYNNATGVLTLTGTTTVANYQTALRSVTYQNSSDNPTASRTVMFIVDDGSRTSSPTTRGITINAVNDPPVNAVPGPQSTNQNTPIVFSSGNGNQISVADSDAGTNSVQVTLTGTNGTLTLNGTSGLAFSVGDGTADATMTFTGSVANINGALNGTSFTPTAGFSGAATLTLTANDQGNTGTGGPLTDTDTVNIQVATNISIQDASVVEPSAGAINMLFTVTLSAPAPAGGTSVNFTTQEQAPAINHATAGQDYTTTSGSLSFAPGEQFKTILVPVLADNKKNEANETFLVSLSNPVNATVARGTATGTILITNQPGTILISELRTSGPAGAGDDFVEVYNNSDSPHTVNDGSGINDAAHGYGLFKLGADCSATPVLIGIIPNGTVIAARGHYLFVGSAYSLANYGGTGAAAGDQTLWSDIESDRNLAIFSTASVTRISTANRLDAVGIGSNTGGICDLLREGTTLPPLNGSVLQYSYFRDECGKKGNPASFGPCPTGGFVADTNVNNNDFIFADTQGTVTAAGQRLGAPGPQNLGSARLNLSLLALLLDATKGSTASPNRVRDLTPQLPNAMQGTMSIRRRFVNNTGAPVTRLRLRIVDISALPLSGGIADLRALNSTTVTVSAIADSATCLAATGSTTTPCTVAVQRTTLETPPAQSLGGAFNSSLTIMLGTPLAPGASVNLQLLLGVQQTGTFKFFFNVEALP
jgi:CSLREA domain-containing protein